MTDPDTFLPRKVLPERPPLRPLYELSNETLAAVEIAPGMAAAPELADLPEVLSRFGLSPSNARLCAQLGVHELTDSAAPGRIARRCGLHGIAPERLCLFFPDVLCLEQGMRAIEQLLLFKRHGFRLGIDIENLDAVSGPFIEMLPADVLRLCPLDTMTRTSDPDAAGELLAFTRFAENLLMTPAASGVQNRGQLNTLKSLGMRIGQGPLFPQIPSTVSSS